eukprot:1883112-Rhodomonas_salina.2
MWRRLGADDAVLVEVDLRGVSLPQRRLQPPHVPRHHRRRSATQPRQLRSHARHGLASVT